MELTTPEKNLACDEAMLEFVENSRHPGLIRFFEPVGYFVVLGYGKKVQEEVHEEACARRSVPILRRCSGGGTVLQGPGCLNFALVLPIDSDSALETITGANALIMQTHRDCLAELLGGDVGIEGVSDLVLEGRKFSGNAQRRKRRSLLFHGSFLLNFDLALISELLPVPTQQPGYRANRAHADFLRNVPVSGSMIMAALRQAWGADRSADVLIHEDILRSTRALARNKYSQEEWNRRF